MSADEPITALPFKKVTVPVGVPVPDEGTAVAVNVTFCPRTDGFGEDVSDVVVAIRLLTVCVKTEEVLALSLGSPLYAAVMECAPAASAEVDNVAVPPLSGALPSALLPSEKVTVPVAAAGDTFAVNVTLCPNAEGFALEDRVVVVLAVFTVCDTALETLLKKFGLPV